MKAQTVISGALEEDALWSDEMQMWVHPKVGTKALDPGDCRAFGIEDAVQGRPLLIVLENTANKRVDDKLERRGCC